MKLKNFILLFIFGLFLFLLPNFAEAACGLSCDDGGEGGICCWGPPYPTDPPNPLQRAGVERIGTIMDILKCQYILGTEYCSRSNGKCKESGFPSGSDGQICVAHDQAWDWGACNDCSKVGNWDYSQSQCIQCNGKVESKYLGNTTGIYDNPCVDPPAGNGKCESACGANDACDEVADGGYCTSGKACSSGTCTGSETCNGCTCTAVAPQPNLKITGIRADGTTIKYDIANDGSATAGASTSYLYIDGSASYSSTDSVPSIYGNSSRTDEAFSSYAWYCTGTSDTIKVCADGGLAVSESNESDNCFTVTLNCTIDLFISAYSISPVSPVAGDTVSFSGTVKNLETSNSKGVTSYTRLRIDERNNGTWDILPANKGTSALAPGATETENWSSAWTAYAGPNKYEICADATSLIAETDETNNCITQVLTVPSGTLSCSSSTTSSITLSYSFSYGTNVSLFRGSTLLITFSGSSGSSTYTDSGLSAGTNYTYYLRNGNTTSSALLDSQSCSTTGGPTGTLNCSSSTTSSITLSYSFANGTNVSLFKGSTLLATFSGTSGSSTYTDSGLSAGTSYTYYLRNGTSTSSTLLDSAACTTQTTANNPPICDAGSDKTVNENQTVQFLDSSASDPDSDPLTYSWSCTGGSLNNSSILQPIYTAPSVTADTDYTCTLSVSDGKGGNCSDPMIVHVKDVPAGATIVSPSVITVSATVTKTSATLNGYLNSLGYDTGTCPNCQCIVWFEWGTSGTAGVSGSYGNTTTPIPMNSSGPFTAVISGLTPGQTYKFEAFAKNGGSW